MQNSHAYSSHPCPTCRKLRLPEGFGPRGGGNEPRKGRSLKGRWPIPLSEAGRIPGAELGKETAFRFGCTQPGRGVLRAVGTGRGRSRLPRAGAQTSRAWSAGPAGKAPDGGHLPAGSRGWAPTCRAQTWATRRAARYGTASRPRPPGTGKRWGGRAPIVQGCRRARGGSWL